MVSAAFTKMASVSATTKRQNAAKDGLEDNITAGLVCLPVMPASQDLLEQIGIHSAREKFETYAAKQPHTDSSVVVDRVPDIDNGDEMTVDGVAYIVTFTTEWSDGRNDYVRVLLDKERATS